MAESTYTHPELLASAAWLAEHRDDARLKIVDARGADEYAEAHIPGALLLPAGAFRSTGDVPGICTADEFSATAGALGIGADDVVVCYDAAGPAAGRAWWSFTHFGHRDVRFLNGGIRQWLAGGHPTNTLTPSIEPASYRVEATDDSLVCSLPQAVAAVDDGSSLFWDVRTDGEFSGATPRDNPPDRAGHLPGAVHLEWTELVDAGTGLFKAAHAMETILQAKGITPEKTIAAY